MNLNVVYETITGSTSYGTSLDKEMVETFSDADMVLKLSDEDRKGIFLPKPEEIFSLTDFEETVCLHEPEDREYHSLGKFLKLSVSKQNPTSLEMLNTEKRFITNYHECMDLVMEIKDTFLTKNCYMTFSGYARDQLIRIKNSLERTTKDEMETHIDYVLNRVMTGVNKRYNTFNEDTKNFLKVNNVYLKDNGKYSVDIDMSVINGSFEETFGLLNEMNNTLKNYNKLKNRNKKSDLNKLWKHASHLVRLLICGIEILKGEGLQVYRYKDRDLLLDIRLGKWTWEMFFQYVEELFKELEDWNLKTKLPENVDTDKVNKVYKKIMLDYLVA